ncbi:DUF6703 family protein [Phytomonospora sp. NPDC050363]|uniref:DUF6703 family protein n=1 Tax=Phytomonospora sp. NPDC050363 TaxID=3155642 RepID=UPI0033D2EB72
MVDHSQTNGQANGGEAPVRWLLWLERLPKVAIFLAVLVVALGLLFTPGIPGAVLVLALAAGTAFMVYATWSKAGTVTRLVRILVVLALAGLGVAKFFI